jgi:hypothetical protein
MRRMFIALVVLAGCSHPHHRERVRTVYVQPAPEPAPPEEIVVQEAPPAPRVEVVPAAPYAGAVWIGGHWRWEGRRHVWVGGHYERARPGFAWEPAHWPREPHGWRFVPGHWRH